jgi:hypothetical protein
MVNVFPPSSCKKQINKHNFYLLLAFLQYGSVPELDMHESKHFLPGQFVHSGRMERNVLKGRFMNKDDKNRHFVLLIIDISKHGAKEMGHVFCGTLSLISQLIDDDIAKMFHLTAGNG